MVRYGLYCFDYSYRYLLLSGIDTESPTAGDAKERRERSRRGFPRAPRRPLRWITPILVVQQNTKGITAILSIYLFIILCRPFHPSLQTEHCESPRCRASGRLQPRSTRPAIPLLRARSDHPYVTLAR